MSETASWQEWLRAAVDAGDLAAVREQLFDSPEAMLGSELARAVVVEAIDAALAEGVSEAEIDVELAAYRLEGFSLDAFVAATASVIAERERRFPELRGRSWATLDEVARRQGVGEGLGRARYEHARARGVVSDVQVPEAARGGGPTFAPRTHDA